MRLQVHHFLLVVFMLNEVWLQATPLLGAWRRRRWTRFLSPAKERRRANLEKAKISKEKANRCLSMLSQEKAKHLAHRLFRKARRAKERKFPESLASKEADTVAKQATGERLQKVETEFVSHSVFERHQHWQCCKQQWFNRFLSCQPSNNLCSAWLKQW